ncbi:MAG TPA: hypothetical protein VFJ94_12845 [Intrasporangium sp.]|uniref:hypothetical protein n=1 Tax=Intrasporangium sp. TaxID=1925024 RepID=UPI002D796FB7|nr:hypothetical protein [Intrasporangium sp.]HET7399399.1 hypothetical protein [Intrasporangium sp.]
MRAMRLAVATAAAIGVALGPAAAARADTPAPGPAYGQHVSECARTMGFSGAHNPGMHQGKAGWDGMPCMPRP